MAKTPGLGATVTCDDATSTPQIISNDLSDFQIATPRAVQDITGIDKSGHERLLLLADYSATLKGTFNAALSHLVFRTIPSTSVNRNLKTQPIAGSTPFLSCLCVLTDYSLTRSNTGDLTWSVPASLADGTVPTWN